MSPARNFPRSAAIKPDSIEALRRSDRAGDKRPKVLSEGDSWFAFPAVTQRKNVISHIKKWTDFRWVRMEGNGDEILEILSGHQRARIREVLEEFDFDAILFSGGGNDIVGPDLYPLLRDRKPSYSALECINHDAFARRLAQIRLSYLDLIHLRDTYDSNARIVTHGYDRPFPSDKGVELLRIPFVRPWMKPYMEKRGITDPNQQAEIAAWMIDQLAGMLKTLESQVERFYVAPTVGTLSKADWGDEIHPTDDGFKMIAEKFRPILTELFPKHVKPAPGTNS